MFDYLFSEAILTLAEPLDREIKSLYQFQIYATDGNLAAEAQSQIKITVLDANDNSPIFSQSEYVFSIEEEQPVGSVLGKVQATDLDAELNGQIVYSIVGTSDFLISSENGTITTKHELDREVISSYVIVVKAQDRAVKSARSSNTKVTISVTDINDNGPKFAKSSYSASILENVVAQDFLTVFVS